jgi:hypothetical protein
VRGGELRGSVRLPITGIVSDRSVPEVAEELGTFRRALTTLGFIHTSSPIMALGVLTLPVSPELKLSQGPLPLPIRAEAHRPVVGGRWGATGEGNASRGSLGRDPPTGTAYGPRAPVALMRPATCYSGHKAKHDPADP